MKRELSFPGIWKTVEEVLSRVPARSYGENLEIILEDDARARETAEEIIRSH